MEHFTMVKTNFTLVILVEKRIKGTNPKNIKFEIYIYEAKNLK
jgi:hypothetical protein